MSDTKTTKQTPNVDPATHAHQVLLQRQRENARRTLLKRRRQKSGQ